MLGGIQVGQPAKRTSASGVGWPIAQAVHIAPGALWGFQHVCGEVVHPNSKVTRRAQNQPKRHAKLRAVDLGFGEIQYGAERGEDRERSEEGSHRFFHKERQKRVKVEGEACEEEPLRARESQRASAELEFVMMNP